MNREGEIVFSNIKIHIIIFISTAKRNNFNEHDSKSNKFENIFQITQLLLQG